MKNNEINNDEEWDHAQYMGIRKTTYDPGSKPRKNKNKNIVNLLKNSFLNSEFSQNAYIKSCESITVPGKKENGNSVSRPRGRPRAGNMDRVRGGDGNTRIQAHHARRA